jgi:hypothetical protein
VTSPLLSVDRHREVLEEIAPQQTIGRLEIGVVGDDPERPRLGLADLERSYLHHLSLTRSRHAPDLCAWRVRGEVLWQASGRIGAHRLHPVVPDLLDRLIQFGDLALAPEIDTLVRQVSRPTLARLLAPARAQAPRREVSTTRAGT